MHPGPHSLRWEVGCPVQTRTPAQSPETRRCMMALDVPAPRFRSLHAIFRGLHRQGTEREGGSLAPI